MYILYIYVLHYIHRYIDVCIYIYEYICTYVYTYINTYIRMYVYVYVYVHVNTSQPHPKVPGFVIIFTEVWPIRHSRKWFECSWTLLPRSMPATGYAAWTFQRWTASGVIEASAVHFMSEGKTKSFLPSNSPEIMIYHFERWYEPFPNG